MSEIYSTFPNKITDDDIYDMLLTGKMTSVCPKCGIMNTTDPEIEIFKCAKCGTEQYVANLNPDEFTKER